MKSNSNFHLSMEPYYDDDGTPICPLGTIACLNACIWSPGSLPPRDPPSFVIISIHCLGECKRVQPAHWAAQLKPANDNWLVERTFEEEDDGA